MLLADRLKKEISKICLKLHSGFQLRKVNKKQNNNVFGQITIVCPKNLEIGSDCSFNHYAYINAQNPIKLGNDVTVSTGAKILSTGVDYLSWSSGKKRHSSGLGITIGDHVWIGADAKILEGVSITGEYVVIAANAVVTKSISDDYVVVAGCPARIIKRFKQP